jgi:DNA-binding MarR family transcriptional regulator
MLAERGYPEVRVPHLRVLLYTPEGTGMRMSQLAERLQLTPGAVTQLVAHLERRGLVERAADPADGRAVIVRPTERTREGYAASRALVSELVVGMRDAVGNARWEVFTATLAEIVEWQEARIATQPSTKPGPPGGRGHLPAVKEYSKRRKKQTG